jgi:hypothetical protein
MGSDVSALIVEKHVAERQNAAGLIDSRSDAVILFARLVCRHEMFPAVLDPLYRSAKCHAGRAYEEIFGVQLAANAKSAADM